VHIDIFDLNFDLSSEDIRQVEVIPKLAKRTIIHGIFLFFAGMLGSIFTLRFNLFFLSKSNVNYLVSSSNQLRALVPIQKELGGKISSITVGYRTKTVGGRYPDALAYLFSMCFIPFFIVDYCKCTSEYKKRAMRACFDRYILSYGLYIVSYLCLVINRPKIIFLSNDHCVWHRVFLKQSKKLNIETAYVQHAMVSKSFPKLEFSYAFLDGIESHNLYTKEQHCSNYLVGALRYHCDSLSKNNVSHQNIKPVLGLCFNIIDSDSFVIETINKTAFQLSDDFDIHVRLHPSDKRHKNGLFDCLNKRGTVIINDSTKVSSMRFLENVDVILAGVSGIHLDAALSGVVPFSLKSWGHDYYGFIEKGLVILVDDVSQLRYFNQKVYLEKNTTLLGMYDAYINCDKNMSLAQIISAVLNDKNHPKLVEDLFKFDSKVDAYVYK